jgi:hypothetical protein
MDRADGAPILGVIRISSRDEEGEIHTARRRLYLPAMIAAAVLVACAVALLAISEKKAEATYPGKTAG